MKSSPPRRQRHIFQPDQYEAKSLSLVVIPAIYIFILRISDSTKGCACFKTATPSDLRWEPWEACGVSYDPQTSYEPKISATIHEFEVVLLAWAGQLIRFHTILYLDSLKDA